LEFAPPGTLPVKTYYNSNKNPIMRITFPVIFLLILPLLNGCVPKAAEVPASTATPSLVPTQTVIWFPETPTSTPISTLEVTPTPEMLTGIGEIAIQDDFSDSSLWESLKRPSGQVVVSPGELAISVSGANGYLFSQRNAPSLQDFYLEATLKTNLCRDGDTFGLLLRTNSFQDYYRWAINCDGYERIERVRAGTVGVLQDWIASAQVLPGAPQTFRLGVLARGEEMRFFVNDLYQFSITDDAFKNGGIGVFARSTDDSPVSVGFRDFQVSNLKEGIPIPTPRVLPQITPKTSETPRK
jgi:hypothetical protein